MEIARNEIGGEVVANIIAVGAISVLTGRVVLKNFEKTLRSRVPAESQKINRVALHRGIDEARKIDLESLPCDLMGDG